MNEIFEKVRTAELELQDAIELIMSTDGFYECKRPILEIYNKLETCSLIFDSVNDLMVGNLMAQRKVSA